MSEEIAPMNKCISRQSDVQEMLFLVKTIEQRLRCPKIMQKNSLIHRRDVHPSIQTISTSFLTVSGARNCVDESALRTVPANTEVFLCGL